MGRIKYLGVIVGALVLCASAAVALPLSVEYIDGPQDVLIVPQEVVELGVWPPFPPFEAISPFWFGSTDTTSCFDGSDLPGVPNQLVQIINATGTPWTELWYVADPETTITNFDGWVGNLGMGDYEEAFRIDSVGINRPLIDESMIADQIFQPGEMWTFILQDWQHPTALLSASAEFDSIGIAGMSAGYPFSTGSIIGIPEPNTAVLLALGAAAMAFYRRKK
ncbi:MAG TPA: PEP-CTERM sorting domain-containing protein [Candidatus Brocadiia bacterium]|nr:PEP-CTERM sorting domain-containing protein [Candidatus Brocadiia bacterium]